MKQGDVPAFFMNEMIVIIAKSFLLSLKILIINALTVL